MQKKLLAVVTAAAFSMGGASLVGQTQTKDATTQPEAKKTVSSDHAKVTETFTIEAIDYPSRVITLKDSKGKMETLTAGPEIKRFNELKPGDKVTMTYTESVVYTIRPSTGTAPPASTTSMHRESTGKPGATMTSTVNASVVVDEIDLKTPSITVKTDSGNVMSFKVNDKKALEKVKVGDRVDIEYTRGLAVQVK